MLCSATSCPSSECALDALCVATFHNFRFFSSLLDRTNGTEEAPVKLNASSLPGAIAKATREFVKGLDRKQRFDLNKNGLQIKAVSVGTKKQAGSVADNPPSAGA